MGQKYTRTGNSHVNMCENATFVMGPKDCLPYNGYEQLLWKEYLAELNWIYVIPQFLLIVLFWHMIRKVEPEKRNLFFILPAITITLEVVNQVLQKLQQHPIGKEGDAYQFYRLILCWTTQMTFLCSAPLYLHELVSKAKQALMDEDEKPRLRWFDINDWYRFLHFFCLIGTFVYWALEMNRMAHMLVATLIAALHFIVYVYLFKAAHYYRKALLAGHKWWMSEQYEALKELQLGIIFVLLGPCNLNITARSLGVSLPEYLTYDDDAFTPLSIPFLLLILTFNGQWIITAIMLNPNFRKAFASCFTRIQNEADIKKIEIQLDFPTTIGDGKSVV